MDDIVSLVHNIEDIIGVDGKHYRMTFNRKKLKGFKVDGSKLTIYADGTYSDNFDNDYEALFYAISILVIELAKLNGFIMNEE